MQAIASSYLRSLIFTLAATLAAGPALAEKPSWAGGDKGGKGQKHERENEGGQGGSRNKGGQASHFNDQHQVVVREYYGSQFQSGRCPPGLAKKNNGCMPPGQAKKWAVGSPLARDVIFYEVPQPLVVQIGLPPSGYRYVRVAGDILMIAMATGIVVDAIRDLGR